MKMKVLSVIVILLASILTIASVTASVIPVVSHKQSQEMFPTHNVKGKTIRIDDPEQVFVDDDYNEQTPGWQIDHFATIQNGVNAVRAEGTVFIGGGSYEESVIIEKTLSLIGEDKDQVIITGDDEGTQLMITADRVQVEQISILHAEIGVYLQQVDLSVLRQVNIFKCDYGVGIEGGINNSVVDSLLADNLHGIVVETSYYSMIVRNTITHSLIGIWLGVGTQENKVVHNTFIENEQHAQDFGTNQWDLGYPSGGNYWDDLLLIDAQHGPFQNLTGSDGLNDFPRAILQPITSIGIDHYPLINYHIAGDMNIDGLVNFDDISPFVLALTNPIAYRVEYQIHGVIHGDINFDGRLDLDDIQAFIYELSQ